MKSTVQCKKYLRLLCLCALYATLNKSQNGVLTHFQVRRVQARIQKAGTLVRSTEMAIDRQMETKDLPPIVIKFCAGFPVYRLKEMNKDSIEIEQEERSSNGKVMVIL